MTNITNLNSKKIAKNSFMLYIRMLFTMLVSLYTSRVILQILGIEDFGLYNVIGGIVYMFGFINMSMTTATSRFISFELGNKLASNESRKTIFSTTIYVHLSIAIIVVLLCETIGFYLYSSKMQIPLNRFVAGIWVFQSSIISIFISILFAPYNSIIIAYEKMSIFALLSIADVVLKLAIVLILPIIKFDKLILYSVLYLLITIILQAINILYAYRTFSECKQIVKYDKVSYLEIFKFAAWNLLGDGAYATFSQGVNILLNMFFGPVVNAARGIAIQINGIALRFTSSFQTAINPQIIKSYSGGNIEDTYTLIMMSSRYTLLLLSLIAIPLFLNIEFILNIWLTNIPPYSSLFVKLMIIITVFDALGNPMTMAINATGDNKKYQLFVGGIMLFIFPIAYMFLKLGYKPQSVFVVHLIIGGIAHIFRIFLVRKKLGFPIKSYFYQIFFKGSIIILVVSLLSILLKTNYSNPILNLVLSSIITLISIILFGLNKNEKHAIINKIFKNR